jgi:hypothetical protein
MKFHIFCAQHPEEKLPFVHLSTRGPDEEFQVSTCLKCLAETKIKIIDDFSRELAHYKGE